MSSSIFSNDNHILDVVTSIQFKDTLLIPIKADITKLFGTNQIKFQLSIKNKKIVFESQEISQDLEIQNSPLALDTIHV